MLRVSWIGILRFFSKTLCNGFIIIIQMVLWHSLNQHQHLKAMCFNNMYPYALIDNKTYP